MKNEKELTWQICGSIADGGSIPDGESSMGQDPGAGNSVRGSVSGHEVSGRGSMSGDEAGRREAEHGWIYRRSENLAL